MAQPSVIQSSSWYNLRCKDSYTGKLVPRGSLQSE